MFIFDRMCDDGRSGHSFGEIESSGGGVHHNMNRMGSIKILCNKNDYGM